MTDPARTREILDSYGADAGRWPADERDAVLAALADDAGLRAVRVDAAWLDATLAEWATRDIAAGDAGAAAARALRPARPWLRWAAGGSIAAALGAAVMVFGPVAKTATPVQQSAAALSDEAMFASVFTPTPDEDDAI